MEKEQIGQLLDIIAVAQSLIAQDIALVPEFLNEFLWIGHKMVNAKC